MTTLTSHLITILTIIMSDRYTVAQGLDQIWDQQIGYLSIDLVEKQVTNLFGRKMLRKRIGLMYIDVFLFPINRLISCYNLYFDTVLHQTI